MAESRCFQGSIGEPTRQDARTALIRESAIGRFQVTACGPAPCSTEELVHYFGTFCQYWPDLSPVDDLCRPGAGVCCQPDHLLDRHAGGG